MAGERLNEIFHKRARGISTFLPKYYMLAMRAAAVTL